MPNRDYYKACMTSAEQGQREQNQIIAGIDAKLSRLWAAYDRVKEQRAIIMTDANEALGFLDDFTEWHGSRRTHFDDMVGSGLSPAVTLYDTNADGCAADIRDAITRLENEKAEANGIIGELQKAWNNAHSWWDKLTD